MMAFYFLSAGAGVGAALLFSGLLGATVLGLSAAGVGIILVIIGIAIALLIELFKTNELQDWMERCLFGVLEEGKRYRVFEQEIEQFEVAMRALGLRTEEDEAEDESNPALVPQAG